MTSPFSIYISVGMLYDQYKTKYFATYIDSGSGICTAKPGVFPKEARETLPVIAERDFSQKLLILNKKYEKPRS